MRVIPPGEPTASPGQTRLAPRLHGGAAPLWPPRVDPGIVPTMRLCSFVLGLAVLAACESGTDAPPGAWELPIKNLDGALLSVWGTGSSDVWTVGADAGSGPNILHYDGARWTRLQSGTPGTLWWVAGQGDNLWMSGDGGTVVRHRIGSDTFDALPTPTPERLYGILPFSDTDVWVVGANDNATAGAIYHWDGDTWSVPPGLTPALIDGLGFYKVWGPSSDDLWIVGEGDAALHHSGGDAWERLDVPGKLFTVHGRDGLVIGVGGSVSGLIVELSPGTVTNVTPPISEAEVEQLNGIHVGANATVAVGARGSVWHREDDGSWAQDPDAPTNPLDYHAAYVDNDGGIWAVGGRLSDLPPTAGMLAHFGQPLQSTTIEE